MKRARNVLELIGATPIVRLNRVVAERGAEVWAKLEAANPGGSVKDRIALAMIEAAEESGQLQPGGTIVEPTSGNTGIGLAMVTAVKGYRLIVTMFDTASRERRLQMQAYGAEVVLTPAAEGMMGAIEKARQLVAENPGYFLPQQFVNPANPDIHRRTTGKEILAQREGKIDALVAGVGTGGSVTGIGEVLEKLSRGFERYVEILSHMRGVYFNILDRLSSGEVYHLERSIDQVQASSELKALQDQFLDTYSEYLQAKDPALKKKLEEMVEKIRQMDDSFNFHIDG